MRADSDDEDEFIGRCVRGAAAYLEKRTAKVYIPGTYRVLLSEWPCEPLEIHRSPFRAIDAIEYLDAVGTSENWASVDPANFRVSARAKSFLLIPLPEFERPNPADCADSIRVIFTAGFDAEDSTFGDGQFPIGDSERTLLGMAVAELYKNRELSADTGRILDPWFLGIHRTYF